MAEVELLQADAFEALASLPDDYAHVAVVDYPWEFSIKNGSGGFDYMPDPEDRDKRGKRVPDIFKMEPDGRLSECIKELERVLVSGSWAFFMADDRFQDTVRLELKESESFILRRNWAWSPGGLGMGHYGRVNHYPIPTATLGETGRYVTDRGTLFTLNGGRSTEYPTEKPSKLYYKILSPPVVQPGERILEPFCGTAPALEVAKSLECDYWGCDVANAALKRAERRSGQATVADF